MNQFYRIQNMILWGDGGGGIHSNNKNKMITLWPQDLQIT